MHDSDHSDVLVVGGGIAGLTAGLFTARAGLDTLLVRAGESILRRNAHVENFPGFPAGVNPRTLLDATERQAREAGCTIREGLVTDVNETPTESEERTGTPRFEVAVDGDRLTAAFVVVATKNDVGFVEDLDVGIVTRGSKTYLDCDTTGRTDLDGLYAAGRVAERPHQAVVAAGHGAETALSLVDDSDVPFYHDWVVPEGYFSDRDREVPPGCEEIDDAERERRERDSMAAMQALFADPHADAPTPHPSLADEE
ncbi:NAD(P)/FAD-dependent oxidoreductase [Halomarina oriensis]|uniref:FAD-binding protein n=1 Tax=Halomarina oriensis TaxID=671145 RepID=A0A6B0GHA6_9EURY|nr:FAD-binding protein [Halomarina oriensis]MWG33337.1 FAD-binding protein [Halomarina oriensis]